VNTSVSGKTDFVVAGTLLEDGRPVTDSSKYKTAVEKKVPILTEDEFIAKIKASPGKAATTTSTAASAATTNSTMSTSSSSTAPIKTQQQQSVSSTGRTLPFPSKASASSSSSSSSSSSAAQRASSSSSSAPAGGFVEDRLWVDKYKPSRIDDVIGSVDIARR
jgi:BRCA1 C Terminus (BRCT) domain